MQTSQQIAALDSPSPERSALVGSPQPLCAVCSGPCESPEAGGLLRWVPADLRKTTSEPDTSGIGKCGT